MVLLKMVMQNFLHALENNFSRKMLVCSESGALPTSTETKCLQNSAGVYISIRASLLNFASIFVLKYLHNYNCGGREKGAWHCGEPMAKTYNTMHHKYKS